MGLLSLTNKLKKKRREQENSVECTKGGMQSTLPLIQIFESTPYENLKKIIDINSDVGISTRKAVDDFDE